jgi:AraC-like DNA-binding protein
MATGWSDQAPFTREFRSMFGRTPTAYWNEPDLLRKS